MLAADSEVLDMRSKRQFRNSRKKLQNARGRSESADSKPLPASKSPKLSRDKHEQRATQLSLFDDTVAS